jgi:hypothetical protein
MPDDKRATRLSAFRVPAAHRGLLLGACLLACALGSGTPAASAQRSASNPPKSTGAAAAREEPQAQDRAVRGRRVKMGRAYGAGRQSGRTGSPPDARRQGRRGAARYSRAEVKDDPQGGVDRQGSDGGEGGRDEA